MNPKTVRAALVLMLIVIGVVCMVIALTSCTAVYIEGDGNAINDTGGHTGGFDILPTKHPIKDMLTKDPPMPSGGH